MHVNQDTNPIVLWVHRKRLSLSLSLKWKSIELSDFNCPNQLISSSKSSTKPSIFSPSDQLVLLISYPYRWFLSNVNELILIVVVFVLILISWKMEFEAQKRCPGGVPIVHDSDQYDFIRNIGAGNFGIARLMRNKQTNEQVAIKYIERGSPVSYNLNANYVCLLYFYLLLELVFGAMLLLF